MNAIQTRRADQSTPIDTAPIQQSARIRFRQPVSTAGFVDAAWWPRSHDLTVEAPALMAVLWTAGREINRVAYSLLTWDRAPRRLQIEGRIVRLGGFTVGDRNMLTLHDPWGRERVDILVIAPDTDPERAGRIFDLVDDATLSLRGGEMLVRVAGANENGSAGR